MRGIGSKPKQYISEVDKHEPERFQTVFHLIPRNHERANIASVKYSRAIREGRTGELDPVSMNRADRESFLEYCVRVDRFAFSDDFYDNHPDVRQMADEDGYIDVIDDRVLLIEVARDLPNAILQELASAVNDPVKLTEPLKKD